MLKYGLLFLPLLFCATVNAQDSVSSIVKQSSANNQEESIFASGEEPFTFECTQGCMPYGKVIGQPPHRFVCLVVEPNETGYTCDYYFLGLR